MDLMFGLAALDTMQGDRLGRRLANGWMGWESQRGRQLRALGARALIALAARLAPDESRPAETERPLPGITGA
ncbi:MAG TPA: hypothetical protein VFL91_22185 [Thermomicrobiales bacterium]|nr:hypothetical protein [Thermomicrobiales bacterium]